MKPFHEHMNDYKKLLKKGDIQKAYKGLMDYIMNLRKHLNKKYPDFHISGSIYYGYMDMTYFSFFPDSLKLRKLKTGIVFNYDNFRFEVWLYGYNKKIQSNYWKLFKGSNWNKYHVVETLKGMDSIVENVLVEDPDFSDLDALTKKIETGTLKFIKDIEEFLSKHES